MCLSLLSRVLLTPVKVRVGNEQFTPAEYDFEGGATWILVLRPELKAATERSREEARASLLAALRAAAGGGGGGAEPWSFSAEMSMLNMVSGVLSTQQVAAAAAHEAVAYLEPSSTVTIARRSSGRAAEL